MAELRNTPSTFEAGDAALVRRGNDPAAVTLGDAATKNTGTTAGTVAAGDDSRITAAGTHAAATDNPHGVTKAQVGLANVDNTSDANKPVSTAQQAALDGKQPIAAVLTNTTASFTIEQETKLSGIEAGAEVNPNVFDASNAGLVPASGGGTTTYLRADGTFADPSVGGGGGVGISGTPTTGQFARWTNAETIEGVSTIAWSVIASTPTTLSGYGITDAVTGDGIT
jgi:hypothetical protein